MFKLTLKYPIKPYIKYQSFGDSLACCENNNLPITKRNIIGKANGACPIGYVELYPLLGMKGHTGMDLFGPHGTPVYYSGPTGTVEEIQSESERGLGLGIVTQDKFLFEGWEYQAKTRYWHLKGFNVEYDQVVKTGDLIGWSDNTGLSSGDHLHFELKPVARDSSGKYYNVRQNNGYYGSINPEPYFDGKYAQDELVMPFNQDIYYGERSTEVMKLQSLLSRLGYVHVKPTGYYGSVTKQAVYEFQQKYVAVGVVGSVAVWYNKGRSVLKLTRAALKNIK